MISFTVLANDKAAFQSWAVAQGYAVDAKEGWRPKPDVEIVNVPNPVIATPAIGRPFDKDYVQPVMDSRLVFLLKVTASAEAAEKQGIVQTETKDGQVVQKELLDSTKLGIEATKATPSTVDGTVSYPMDAGIEILKDDVGRFGVWQ